MDRADRREKMRLRFAADQVGEPNVPIDAANSIVAWGPRADMFHCPLQITR